MNVDRSEQATWYLTDDAGVGITRGNVIGVWGNPRELRAQLESAEGSFVAALPGPVSARFSGRSQWHAYLAPERMATFLAGHPLAARSVQADAIVVAKSIPAIDASWRAANGNWLIDAILYAPEQGFSHALQPVVASTIPELAAAAKRLAERVERR